MMRVFLTKTMFLLLVPFLLNGASFLSVDLKNGANSSFRDDFPDDGKGGWTDQGGCDMRLFPAGKFSAGEVEFQILSDQQTGNKSCIVLGNMEQRPQFPRKVKLDLNLTEYHPVLYFLHAGQWLKKSSTPAGIIHIVYKDGSKSKHNFRYGRDLLNWIGDDNTVAKNATKVWSIYNDSSQVSLFVSKLGIKSGKIVQSIELESINGCWMIAGLSLGNAVEVQGLSKKGNVIPENYKLPEPITESGWQAKCFSKKPRNVILVIGDGMGYGAIQAASYYGYGVENKLIMTAFPVKSSCITTSFGGVTTDSAAAGTALSGGYKTKNGMLGVNPEGSAFNSIAAEARKNGMSVAFVTTDHLIGSTPAAFYTHVSSRTLKAEIAASALDSHFDFLIASPDRRYFLPPKSLNGVDFMKRFEEQGYQLFDSKKVFLEAGSLSKAVGTFSLLGTTDDLAKVSEKVMQVMKNNKKGFFLMIESGIPDQGGHANRPEKTVFGTLCADYAARTAAIFAIKEEDTLVIVTADHETGGVSAVNNQDNCKQVKITYASGSHTSQDVPIFAYGPGSERFANKLDNTEIPKIVADLLGLSLGNAIKK